MATAHQVTITMDAASAQALADSGYALYAFAAVRCADGAALPLVWMRTQEYSTLTYVEWGDGWWAYTSSSPILPGARVKVGFSASIEPGQVLTVSHSTGTGSVGPAPDAAQFWLANLTHTRFTCGVSREHPGGASPVCAAPLYGGGANSITPLPTVLLMFSTAELAPGTAVDVSSGPALLLEVAGPERAVSFGINTGWLAQGSGAALAVAPLTPLAPLLVQPPPLTGE
jgi:hypothetical protein